MTENGLWLSPIICNGMVLQRDENNLIYGKDSKADRVTISFMGKEYCTKVDDNQEFEILLPPVSEGGPYSMKIMGSSEIEITDILFGDVYILSGQSNMELPVRRVLDVSAEEVSETHDTKIRQYLVPATYNFNEPEKYMCASEWKKAVDEDIMDFSAAGLFFAKELRKAYDIPVGLIMTAIGGSPIEAWMNTNTLRRFGDFEKLVEDYKNINNLFELIQNQQEKANEWNNDLEEKEEKAPTLEELKSLSTCRVPSLVSDYMKEDFQGSVYLYKEVVLEKEPINEDSYIYMGTIIDADKIWINDQLVGRTEYRYPPRKYKIPKGVLKEGSNLIIVRIVINNKNGGTIKGMPYHLYYDGNKVNLEGEWYYRIGKRAEKGMPGVLFPPLLPISFYNTAVVPLSKVKVKGVLWYQGESNAGASNYTEKFAAMVSDWRELFGPTLPFIYVQLPNYREPLSFREDNGWALMRDQQRKCLEIEDVAMVIAIDIGEPWDLHPQNKKEVGVRLAKAARNLIYHETVEYCGPLPKDSKVENGTVRIQFQYLENSLEEIALNHFELAGEDGIYHKATAIRKGSQVLVSCNQVETPKAVRYAWCDSPENLNLINKAGIPASSFCVETY